jgi:uncharacterized surface anchored protein
MRALLLTFGILLSCFLGTAEAVGHRSVTGQGLVKYDTFLVPVLASVTVYDSAGTVAGQALTDEAGNFIVEGLKPGSYSVVAEPIEPSQFKGKILPSWAVEVTLHKKEAEAVELYMFFVAP